MSAHSSLWRHLGTLGLVLSSASLLMSLVTLTMRGVGEEAVAVTMEELAMRLEDLETEHDLVLDTRCSMLTVHLYSITSFDTGLRRRPGRRGWCQCPRPQCASPRLTPAPAPRTSSDGDNRGV